MALAYWLVRNPTCGEIMRSDKAIFPFAEFDPILRRDLNAVLASARRDVENALRIRTIQERLALRDKLVTFLREKARAGERDPLRLYGAIVSEFMVPEIA